MDRLIAPRTVTQTVSVHAPRASSVQLCSPAAQVELAAVEGRWRGSIEIPRGGTYWLTVDGGQPLVDPDCERMTWQDGGPRCVAGDPWPVGSRLAVQPTDPVIYELHVKGFGGSFRGVAERLDYLAELGVDVIELMPVTPFDTSNNYWGYMPVVWGAVHEPYAGGGDPAGELADLIAAAHEHGIAVWLDVVFNHTGEGSSDKPTWSLRGLDDAGAYLWDGQRYNDDTGCGNTINPANAEVRRLVFSALDRFARLGVDGFRFDLASILARDGGELVGEIARWARQVGVAIVAEAWDMGRYLVGDPVWVAPWRQWNDRYRDDVRSLLRGEHGQAAFVASRISGSVDLFGHRGPDASVNFVTAHDGLTMYDLTTVDHDGYNAWNAPAQLRPQLMKNYFTVLLLSRGPALFVMGDEFARTQHGHPNPYDIDGPLSWVDWARLDEWRELHDYVAALLRLRHDHPVTTVRLYGVNEHPDLAWHSQSLAWSTGDLYVMLNAWTQPLEFGLFEPGQWELAMSSVPMTGATVPARSSAVWTRVAG